ncbi:hypothetical protein QG37_03616 [Candidozyma auris]|uniref:Uncharacterized protein n=1 Tax=Candidozyma auris TaxID=498019 RepID=A0A0L0NZQ7_CANAR|nr:hypothetical protein QG37_03616 [[Candida] auris]
MPFTLPQTIATREYVREKLRIKFGFGGLGGLFWAKGAACAYQIPGKVAPSLGSLLSSRASENRRILGTSHGAKTMENPAYQVKLLRHRQSSEAEKSKKFFNFFFVLLFFDFFFSWIKGAPFSAF